ncbi:hypothetical protein F5148DRAFT_979165 [Russula earlei]|uniref:Uncharacterized protein n=1 Tax=Russula earlei TaxID=71964 RepID=A0ACC0UCV0_9AGAM|nr:hypothetical protein F5148DRAFT_979165 [Russula earlei]
MSSELASVELSSPLTGRLNDLLDRLGLPFVLDTPLDLTPSLLLAILESLLQSRLPISSSVRESCSDTAKVQAMKIFLGILETDVLNEDIGVSDIDPRRLAAGEWEEVVFIAKLLCWLGKQMGLLPSKHTSSTKSLKRPTSTAGSSTGSTASIPGLPGKASPSTRSTATSSINSSLSFERGYQDSDTTVQSVHSDVTETRQPRDERFLSAAEHRRRPQCIHEIEDPSFLAQGDDEDLLRAEYMSLSRDTDDEDDAYCNCSQDERAYATFDSRDRSSGEVRYDGYIQEVDAGLELRTFEARKATERFLAYSTPEKSGMPSIPRYPTESRPITRHATPSHHTLALLDERAKLLSKLANLDLNIASAFSGRS